MRRKKIIRKLVIPIVIFLILVGIFFLFDFLSSIGKYKIFAFSSDEYLLYQESNKEWFSISEKEFLKDYSKLTYDLYTSGVKRGNFKFDVFEDSGLEIVNAKNNVMTRFSSNWYAYSGNSKTNYIKTRNGSFDIEDEAIIFKQLELNNLYNPYNISYAAKYVLNIDGDTSNEYIYVATNMVDYSKKVLIAKNDQVDKVYSFMFLYKNGKYYDIYNKITDIDNVKEVCLPTLEGALSFKKDKSVKIISYCEYLADDSYKLDLYNYKDGKFSAININN